MLNVWEDQTVVKLLINLTLDLQTWEPEALLRTLDFDLKVVPGSLVNVFDFELDLNDLSHKQHFIVAN